MTSHRKRGRDREQRLPFFVGDMQFDDANTFSANFSLGRF
jgi:hypothetical protein